MSKNTIKKITYAQAINEAIDQVMGADNKVFVIGLGVPDPKGIFGTTAGLIDKYGKKRVFDMPASENAVTGICLGAALSGFKPIMTHQRIDFSLYSFDQLINNIAKWKYMFGKQIDVPFVIRMIIGRGWGQGAQHSQNIHSLFAQIPGLRIIMPSTAYDVKGMLISAIESKEPVICIEHRWLYNLEGNVPKNMYKISLDKSNIIREGSDLTIVTSSYMAIESIRASKILEELDLDVEIIDLRTINPIDSNGILESVKKTGRLLVVDSGWRNCGLAGEIISIVCENAFNFLKVKPCRITLPDMPTPTSYGLTKSYYPGVKDIVSQACKLTGKSFREDLKKCESNTYHDVPSKLYTGPY